ncbi:hypothetical protein ACA910_022411 [Epithemia clementina (nom. ined.)]
MQATFWSWPKGSSVFFWRWPCKYQHNVAMGVAPMWDKPPAKSITRQGIAGDEATTQRIRNKINNVRNKGYIQAGPCVVAMNYFLVPKGENDVRIVYDGTKSGLNDCLYAPWFPLPDSLGLSQTLDDTYWCIDNDYGEMFLNFWLHPNLQQYSGMDFTTLFGVEDSRSNLLIGVWHRCPTGQTPSPCITIQQTPRLKRLILGDPMDQNNVFAWDRVCLNLPGAWTYQPGVAWITKIRKSGQVAANAHNYVDDLRGTAPTHEEAWQVGSKIAKEASFYGVQDAARKRRPQTQRPGAWVGVVCGTQPNRPHISVTKEKWICTKQEIQHLKDKFLACDQSQESSTMGTMLHKLLEQVAGFLKHVVRAFTTIHIYLNGIYATMNVWQPDRDEEGWKIGEVKIGHNSLNPERVRPGKRLAFDIAALEGLTAAEDSPDRYLRPRKYNSCTRYYFADASGGAYGLSGWSPDDSTVEVNYGTWDHQVYQGSSSNYRELANIVQKIEELDAEGRLNEGLELFIFTDNVHTESAFYKGTAKLPKVLDLMYRVHCILMKGYAFIHIIWVAGKRMIQQGTDGLSRSDLTTGAMMGAPIETFIPLHKSALERQPQQISLLLQQIAEGTTLNFLEARDWFIAPFESDGVFVWLPPPCITDHVVFLMAEAIHLRPWNTHLLIVPSILSRRWQRALSKTTDVIANLPFDDLVWPQEKEHENLTLAIAFLLLARQPWRVKRSNVRSKQENQLRTLHKQSFAFARHHLRELWLQASTLESMPTGVPRALLQD